MDTFILKSEIELRKYINSHKNIIMKIIVFEDTLDNVVYFYCFTKNIMLATKEFKKFECFINIYNEIYKELDFKTYFNKDKVLKLIK